MAKWDYEKWLKQVESETKVRDEELRKQAKYESRLATTPTPTKPVEESGGWKKWFTSSPVPDNPIRSAVNTGFSKAFGAIETLDIPIQIIDETIRKRGRIDKTAFGQTIKENPRSIFDFDSTGVSGPGRASYRQVPGKVPRRTNRSLPPRPIRPRQTPQNPPHHRKSLPVQQQKPAHEQ